MRARRNGQGASTDNRAFWALRNVDLQVRQGEVLGIIGRNGAGKSTLLKILSRITEPTTGYVDICGRVGALLEVGTGFHPELSGRENVYLNGAILGMRHAEVDQRLDEIVAFADVSKFLDTPVKHYSSGMYLRLAFAVAAHVNPDILLVDEVLAVGDLAFQRKCTGKMGEVARQGRTVLFVSHNLAAVSQLCSSAILLEAGEVAAAGPVDEVLREYTSRTMGGELADLALIQDRTGEGATRFQSVRLEGPDGAETTSMMSGHPARIVLTVKSAGNARNVHVALGLRNGLDQRIMFLDSRIVGSAIPELPDSGELVCEIPRVHLAPGRYNLELLLECESRKQDYISNAGALDVVDGNFHRSGVALTDGAQVALMDFSWFAQAGEQDPDRRTAFSAKA